MICRKAASWTSGSSRARRALACPMEIFFFAEAVLDLLGKLQEPQIVRDRRPVLAHLIGDLLLGVVQFLDIRW